jgi:hypothetical protein
MVPVFTKMNFHLAPLRMQWTIYVTKKFSMCFCCFLRGSVHFGGYLLESPLFNPRFFCRIRFADSKSIRNHSFWVVYFHKYCSNVAKRRKNHFKNHFLHIWSLIVIQLIYTFLMASTSRTFLTSCNHSVNIINYGQNNHHTYTYGRKTYPVREDWAGYIHLDGIGECHFQISVADNKPVFSVRCSGGEFSSERLTNPWMQVLEKYNVGNTSRLSGTSMFCFSQQAAFNTSICSVCGKNAQTWAEHIL